VHDIGCTEKIVVFTLCVTYHTKWRDIGDIETDPRLTHYHPAMTFGNRKKYILEDLLVQYCHKKISPPWKP